VEERTSIRVGADLTRVSDVAGSVARFGDRYLRRIFTDHELASCGGRPEVLASGLAARFAAKEAVVKILRPDDVRPEWRSIEVRRDGAGACDLRLTGLAAALAAEAGIDELAVSLTHEGDLAAAVVIATLARPADKDEAS
jgi:holo-[acyl-carrier protein] synthase